MKLTQFEVDLIKCMMKILEDADATLTKIYGVLTNEDIPGYNVSDEWSSRFADLLITYADAHDSEHGDNICTAVAENDTDELFRLISEHNVND